MEETAGENSGTESLLNAGLIWENFIWEVEKVLSQDIHLAINHFRQHAARDSTSLSSFWK